MGPFSSPQEAGLGAVVIAEWNRGEHTVRIEHADYSAIMCKPQLNHADKLKTESKIGKSKKVSINVRSILSNSPPQKGVFST